MTYNEYHSTTPPAMTGPTYKGGRRRRSHTMRGGDGSATGNMIKAWNGDYVPVNSPGLFGPIRGGRRRRSRRVRGGDENDVPENLDPKLVEVKKSLRPVVGPPPRDVFGRKLMNAGRRTRRHRRRFHTRRV